MTIRLSQLIVIFYLFVYPTLSISQPGEAKAIRNVTIIDALNGVRTNHTVIFQEDKITKIENSSEITETTTAIDGTGKFLIPGLWDFHVHLTYEDSLIEKMPELFLSYGITSVRDTGGLLDKLLPIVNKMRSEGARSPRVFYAGPLLDGKDVVYDGQSRPHIGVQNSSADEAKQRIEFLKSKGVSFIKIYELVNQETFRAMVDAAEKYDLPIDSHVPLSMRARYAGPLVDSIEHLRNIELDCARDNVALHEERLAILKNEDDLTGYALRSKLHRLQRIPAIKNYSQNECLKTARALGGTLQVPTLRLNSLLLDPPHRRTDWDEAFSGLPNETQTDWARTIQSQLSSQTPNTQFAEWSVFLVGLMKENGVPIGAGTDTPIGLAIPGYSLHAELRMLVRAGLTPMQALEAATVQPAKYFSLLGEMGSIDIDKRADMVLLDRNPLESISNTRSISHVISRGKIFSAKDFDQQEAR